MLARFGRLTWFTAIAVIFGYSSVQANCTGNWDLRWTMPLTASDYGGSLSNVMNQNGFYRAGSVRNNDSRLSFRETPGGTPGIRMNVPKGENKIVSFDTDPLGSPGGQKACLSVDVYYPSGFDWDTAGTKIGVGLWGGDTDSKNSGGWPPALQEGWSVRILNSAKGARAYAYHLNRDGNLTSEDRCSPYQCEYGETMGNYVHFKQGAWNNVQIEVRMNTVGSANGVLRAWVNGSQIVSKTNLQWRKSSSWAIRGLKFTDMWGGNTADPSNFSPKNQEMFYRNFKLYSDGTSRQSSSSGSSGTEVSGGFAPVSPADGVTIQPFSRVQWASHENADKYYVRIIDRNNGNTTRMQETYQPYLIQCSGGNLLCDVPYTGSNLRNGEHRMILRAIRSNNTLKEYSFDFQISSNGSAQPADSSQGSGDTGTTGSGGFGPVFPGANADVASLSEITWGSHGNAGRYYVRLIDRSRSANRILDKFDASALGCASGGDCRLGYSGSLQNGPHRLIVRALNGSTRLDEFTIDFDVSSSGSSSGSSGSSSGSADKAGSSSVQATSPSGTISDSTPRLAWSAGGYDKYYVKIVTASGSLVKGQTISPAQAGCSSGSSCAFNWGSLADGSYVWHVRGVKDGTKTAYSSLAFTLK